MATFSELQRKWVEEFLRRSLGVSASSPPPIQVGGPVEAAPALAATVFRDRSQNGNDIAELDAKPTVQMSQETPDGSNDATKGGKETSGNGSGSSGGGGNDKTKYPGHGPTPDGSYPKEKKEPTDAEKRGRYQAKRDLERNPSNPKSTYDQSALKKKNYKKIAVGDDGSPGVPLDEHGQPVDPKNLHSDTDLKKVQDEYLDPSNKKGKSVRDLKVSGKTFEKLHEELEAKGFRLQDREGRLQDYNPATKKMEYKLRDGTFTTDLEVAKKNGVPQYIYVHEDGGMVRLKPEGTPGNPNRNEVNISKSVLYKAEFDANGKVRDASFNNEAFKVGDDGKIAAKQPTVGVKMGPDGNPAMGKDGKPIQKTPTDAGGMRKEPRGMEPKIENPTNDPKIEALNKEIEKRNAARKKGYDDVAMEKGHVQGPITPKGGNTPTGTTGGTGTGETGGAKPGTGSTAAKVVIPGADEFIHNAEAHDKLSKDPKADPEKFRKQNTSLGSDGEKVAKELHSRPEFSDIRGTKAKEFFAGVRSKFGSVRAGASNLVLLALNVADAYAMVEQARFLLDSKDIVEFEKKAFELAKGAVKERIKFGVLRFAFRSTPVAIGITVFLGDMGESRTRMSPAQSFGNQIAELVNKLRPGAVTYVHYDTVRNFADEEAKKLYQQAYDQAVGTMKGNIESGMYDFGHEDGLVGASVRTKFELSDEEKAILGIDEKWMEQKYKKGLGVGAQKRTEAIKRAREKGYKTGIKGEPAKLETLFSFPEVEAMRQRDFNQEGRTDFSFTKSFDQYKTAYNEGYAEGSKKFGTRTLESLEFLEGKTISGTQYRTPTVTAVAKYTAGPDVMVTDQGVWKSSQPDKVEIYFGGGRGFARLKAPGTSTITLTYQDGGVTKEATMEVKVTVPQVKIGPENRTYQVGDEMAYTADIVGTRVSLPYDQTTWTVKPEGIVKLAPVPSDLRMVYDGNGVLVTMLKPGDVTITVTNKEKTIKATTKLSVKPATVGAH
jgi:hypothetical protein